MTADAGRTTPGDLHGLERRVQQVPETIEEFGPDYAIELDPTAHKVEGSWIRDATLGANDGLVSVLTLIAGVAGAAKGNVVLLAGVSALVAGAISMGVGAFVSPTSNGRRSGRCTGDGAFEERLWRWWCRPSPQTPRSGSGS